jgi:peptide/nickel transport system ATP-binding protein
MSLIFISHDIGVIGRIADRTLVMFGGRQMEQGETAEVLRNPTAAYTQTLLAAMPRRTRGGLARGAGEGRTPEAPA